jgi:hypothetical protein
MLKQIVTPSSLVQRPYGSRALRALPGREVVENFSLFLDFGRVWAVVCRSHWDLSFVVCGALPGAL